MSLLLKYVAEESVLSVLVSESKEEYQLENVSEAAKYTRESKRLVGIKIRYQFNISLGRAGEGQYHFNIALGYT